MTGIPGWPRVVALGSMPTRFVALVELGPAADPVRVLHHTRTTDAWQWRCDVDGDTREPDCPHTRAARHLTTEIGWARRTKRKDTP